MLQQDASYWIKHLQLSPHPEGGFYKEVFRSEMSVNRVGAPAVKQACTSIYYLLEGYDYSGFHRLLSDEIWYFHTGSPLQLHVIDEAGEYTAPELSDSDTGNLSIAIKAGLWFAASVLNQEGFTLVSCAVAPGFDFSEFEMARKETLEALYPRHAGVINKLCRQL